MTRVVGTDLSTLPCHVALFPVTQMWMSALWRGPAPTDSVSTWMAPSDVLATGATRWHLMGRVAKVPRSSWSRPTAPRHVTHPARGFPGLFLSAWLWPGPDSLDPMLAVSLSLAALGRGFSLFFPPTSLSLVCLHRHRRVHSPGCLSLRTLPQHRGLLLLHGL